MDQEDAAHTRAGIARFEGDRVCQEPRPLEYDRAAVDALVVTMHEKLRANAHKGPWDQMSPIDLWAKGMHELEVELYNAINAETADHIRAEAADVANFAMMLHSMADRTVEGRPW